MLQFAQFCLLWTSKNNLYLTNGMTQTLPLWPMTALQHGGPLL